jgi:hypothetical protein
VPIDRLSHCLEIGVLDDRDVLGVEPLRQRREADEIGEENGDDPPLDRARAHGREPSPLLQNRLEPGDLGDEPTLVLDLRVPVLEALFELLELVAAPLEANRLG